MIPLQMLTLKQHTCNQRKDRKTDDLLYDLELDKREGTSVTGKANTIGRHLQAILEESNTPTECYDCDKRPIAGGTGLIKFEMPIPRQGHEYIATYQEQYGI